MDNLKKVSVADDVGVHNAQKPGQRLFIRNISPVGTVRKTLVPGSVQIFQARECIADFGPLSFLADGLPNYRIWIVWLAGYGFGSKRGPDSRTTASETVSPIGRVDSSRTASESENDCEVLLHHGSTCANQKSTQGLPRLCLHPRFLTETTPLAKRPRWVDSACGLPIGVAWFTSR